MMGLASRLSISVGGHVKIIRLFEMEELQTIFKNLYFGYFNQNKKYLPGEVSAEQFKLKQIREMLDKVKFSVDFDKG
jgi:hypothetical protein